MNSAEEEIYNCIECGSQMVFVETIEMLGSPVNIFQCPNVACNNREHKL